MDQLECTTKSQRRKETHLSYEEKLIIQVEIRDDQLIHKIVREIGGVPNTVCNKKSNKVLIYNGKQKDSICR